MQIHLKDALGIVKATSKLSPRRIYFAECVHVFHIKR
jgi:hypothetical protein